MLLMLRRQQEPPLSALSAQKLERVWSLGLREQLVLQVRQQH
jgi:hypothetical protein